jgi:transposase
MMARKRLSFQLSKQDSSSLTDILSKGSSSAREQTRARILDLLHRQKHPKTIADVLGVSIGTVYNVQNRYLQAGLEVALGEKPRSGKPPTITVEEKARITALACSDAPEGHARWTLRLLADKAVEMGYIESISHNEVGKILKKTLSDRTNESNGVSVQ